MSHAVIDRSTLLLDRGDIASLLTLRDCITAVETAFRQHAEGDTLAPALMHVDAPDGEFHVKAGGFCTPTPYFALKANAGFFHNAERFGLPNIQGLILLYSAEHGRPLAIMDSQGITVQRTGAATAVAARYLARSDSSVVTVCGCGTQGRIQLQALCEVLPVQRAFAYSIDAAEAEQFAGEMQQVLGIEVTRADDLAQVARASDVCVTCTPSRRAFFERSFAKPGSFIAAVGADSPEKQEIDPHLTASCTLVVDLLEQAASVGELHHAIDQGLMQIDDVHGELGAVIADRVSARSSPNEIIMFDSTGTALQDAAAAILAYERAVSSGRGTSVDLTAASS